MTTDTRVLVRRGVEVRRLEDGQFQVRCRNVDYCVAPTVFEAVQNFTGSIPQIITPIYHQWFQPGESIEIEVEYRE